MALIAIVLSLTVTLIYLIFYSMSHRCERALDSVDTNFKYFAIFTLVYLFLVAEFLLDPIKLNSLGGITLFELLEYATISVFVLVLILV